MVSKAVSKGAEEERRKVIVREILNLVYHVDYHGLLGRHGGVLR